MSWAKFDSEVKSLMHSLRYWTADKKTMDYILSSKIWYHRIDEAFLIISRFMDTSFVSICQRYNVSYERLQKLRDNEERLFWDKFKMEDATYGLEEERTNLENAEITALTGGQDAQ